MGGHWKSGRVGLTARSVHRVGLRIRWQINPDRICSGAPCSSGVRPGSKCCRHPPVSDHPPAVPCAWPCVGDAVRGAGGRPYPRGWRAACGCGAEASGRRPRCAGRRAVWRRLRAPSERGGTRSSGNARACGRRSCRVFPEGPGRVVAAAPGRFGPASNRAILQGCPHPGDAHLRR